MIRAAIVEDEKQCAQILGQYLNQFALENHVEISIQFFENGMDIAGEYNPLYDIVFLDIEMPLLDGMATARAIRKLDSEVILIFITNLAQYAIQGYSVSAMDYILKPVHYGSFSMKMQKALHVLRKKEKKYLLVPYEGEKMKVDVSDIVYIEVRDHQLIIHLKQSEYRIYQSLKSIQEQLGTGFARCNNCYLVNLRYVNGIKGETVVVGEHSLKISRPKKREFMEQLAHYYQ